MNENNSKMTGGCHCAAVRYKITGDPMFSGHCHCRDCQKASGAGHISAAMFPEDKVEIEGAVSEYQSTADSGATVKRCFCPQCASRLFARNSGMPGVLAVMIGTLDDPNLIEPQISVYAKHRNSWDLIDAALPAFAEMPPPPPGA